MFNLMRYVLVGPANMARYMNIITPHFQNRQNIGFQGFTNHNKLVRLNIQVEDQF